MKLARALSMRCQLITRLVNIGDADRWQAILRRPHRQLNGQELEQAGVTEDMVRLSIGIEHIEDIKADLDKLWLKQRFI